MRVATCPDPVDLERLFLGGLPADDAEALEQHVLQCNACSARLEQLFRAKDTLSAVLGEKSAIDPDGDDPVVADLIKKVESLRPAHGQLPQGNPMITLNCSSCQKKLSVKENLAGKKVKCPGCGQLATVPAAVLAAGPNLDDMRTLPPAPNLDLMANGPSQPDASAAPTHPPSEAPDNTVGVKPDGGRDSSLTDFLGPPQAPDELGRLGKYRILKILGHGGMGVVYKAEDTMLLRTVAIKAMLPTLAASASAGKRFLREARTMAAVKHDHIASIYDVGEDRGVPYLAMEFLVGEPLDERLKRDEQLSLDEMLRIGREIGDGLGAAHATGLIHRDIKPANIWLETRPPSPSGRGVGGEGRVKILDFGLARAATQDSGLTQQGAIIGTPSYMSPEQGRGENVDARCDLWSFGVVLYRMCTGQQPFQGRDTVSTLMAVAMNDPAAPIQLNKALPAELSELVMKLLEKDPAKRTASAAEVVQAIQAIEQKLARKRMDEEKTEALNAADPKHGIKERGGARGEKRAAKGEKLKGSPERAKSAAPGQRNRRPLVIAAVLFLVMLLCGGVGTFGVIRFSMPEGDFVVETDDPDFKFSVSKGAVILEDAKTKRTYNVKAVRKASGEYELDVTDVGAELSFRVKTFTIKRGDVFALTATFEPRQGAAVKAADASKFKNSLGMEFALVPKGKAWLGGGGGKVGDDEVEFKNDFYLGTHEVTQGEWEAIMGANPSAYARQGAEAEAVKAIPDADLKRFPVENLTFEDCQVFIKKLNEKVKENGWIYRLPTAAEWEYACRGGPSAQKEDFGFHYYFDKPGDTALFEKANIEASKLLRPREVGAYPANKLGLFDMHGNVWEMCGDADGRKPTVFRGGSFTNDGPNSASEWEGLAPTFKAGDVGFRLARVPTSTPTPRTPAEKYVLRFAGDDAVTVPTVKLGPRSPITIEAYIRCDSVAPGKDYNPFIVGVPGSLTIYVEHDGSDLRAGCRLADKEFYRIVRKDVWTLGKRLHVAAVRTNDRYTLFVDGKEAGRKALPDGELFTDATPFRIGGRINGEISEVRVSNVARYTGTFTPQQRFEMDKDTVALYHCDDGSGDVLKDSSGNSHHGKIVGAKWVKADGSPIEGLSPPPATVWSLDFDGNGRVNLPDLALKVDEPLTAEVWVTPRVQTSDKNHVFRVGWIHQYINRDTRKWQSTLPQSDPKRKESYRVFWSDQEFLPGKRTHLAAVWSGKEIQFYVNGQMQSGHDQVLIGKAFWKSFDLGDMFQGQFHQFRVSKAERYKGLTVPISERFDSDDKTLLLYRFDEGQGDKLTDLSGKGNHGKIVGAKWLKADGVPGPWCSLFNGKDLTGWNIWNPNKDGKAEYVSEDGLPAIRITPTLGLETPSFGDYHLRFEVKVDEKSKGPHIDSLHAGGNILSFHLWPLMRRNNPNLSLVGEGASFQKAVLRAGRVVAVGETLKGLGLASPAVVFANLAVEPASPWVRLEIIRLGDSFVYVVNGKVAGAVTNVRDIRKGKEEFFGAAPIAFGTADGLMFLRKVEIRDISALPPELFASAPFPPLDPAWLKAVAAMKPEQQIEAVKAELIKRNPGFDGKFDQTIQGNVVDSLNMSTANVTDLAPLRALPNLRFLHLSGTPAKRSLVDLAPLKDLKKLKQLHLGFTQVTDLAPLKDLPLDLLGLGNSYVSDLSPLKDMKFWSLDVHFTKVTDLTPLKGVPLATLQCDLPVVMRNAEILRSIPTLKTINNKDAKEVLKGASTSAFPPLDPAWLKAVAAMKADKQVEAVKNELMRRNPSFDGKLEKHVIDKAGVVTELQFFTDNVTDISPVRALSGLQMLTAEGSGHVKKKTGKLADLSPLQGMKLTQLYLLSNEVSDLAPLKDLKLKKLGFGLTNVSDLAPLKGMPLDHLDCSLTPVVNLAPLKGMPLTYVGCFSTKVADLAPLKGMKLDRLYCNGTQVADLAPLQGMPLTVLWCRGTKATDLTPLKGMPLENLQWDVKASDVPILRSIPTLKTINYLAAPDVLKEAEAKKAGK